MENKSGGPVVKVLKCISNYIRHPFTQIINLYIEKKHQVSRI